MEIASINTRNCQRNNSDKIKKIEIWGENDSELLIFYQIQYWKRIEIDEEFWHDNS